MAETAAAKSDVLSSLEIIESQVLVMRGRRISLSPQLAMLCEVETRALNQAVQRNVARFPADFMIQLSWDELEGLRSQRLVLNEIPAAAAESSRSHAVTLKRAKNVKYAPYAFSEQGGCHVVQRAAQ